MKKYFCLIAAFLCSVSVTASAKSNGYGIDLSYQSGLLNNNCNGTFEYGVIYPITSARYIQTLGQSNSSLFLNTTATTCYLGDTTYARVTSEAKRRGNNGVLIDFSKLDNQRLTFQISNKIDNTNTRDMYCELMFKADGTAFDGNYIGFDTVSNVIKRTYAPIGIFSTVSDSPAAVENEAVEENDGWKKLIYIVEAERITNGNFTPVIGISSNAYTNVGDRSYIYIDDIYIAECPREIGVSENTKTQYFARQAPSLEDFTILGYDKDGNSEKIPSDHPRLKFSIVDGPAHISNGKIIFDGNKSDEVVLKAEFLTKEVNITLKFQNGLTLSGTSYENNTYTAEVSNDSDIPCSGTVVLCGYDEAGVMTFYRSEKAYFGRNSENKLTFNDVSPEYTLKAYVLNGAWQNN